MEVKRRYCYGGRRYCGGREEILLKRKGGDTVKEEGRRYCYGCREEILLWTAEILLWTEEILL